MNTFPLIRTRWSNEHVMAAVLIVLILYHFPMWLKDPMGILRTVVLIVFGLLIDAICIIIRNRRIWCCVSSAVTAAMISLLTPNVPFWGQFIGVIIALLLGKQLFGGTGKNKINPALCGVLFLYILFGAPSTIFTPTWLLLPAIILGLVFIPIRPYASVAFILGMSLAILFSGELNVVQVLEYGVFFWGCLVMTDPVTITKGPISGAICGFLVGFLPLLITHNPIGLIIFILIINLVGDEISKYLDASKKNARTNLKIPKLYQDSPEITFIDLTKKGLNSLETGAKNELTKEEILNRIEKNRVFGMGGAAFSTIEKIRAVMNAEIANKYFIINGVECDPGLVHDKWLLQNCFEDIRKGIELLQSCIEFKSTYLAIKDGNEVFEHDQLNICKVSNHYPIGAEKLLIETVLKRSLSSQEIPATQGILVLNVQTVYTIALAVYHDEPVRSKFLTVADLKSKSAKVVQVPIGLKLKDLMEQVYPGNRTIFAGGGIMQAHLVEEDAVVEPSVNFVAAGIIPDYKESPQCSGCGLCSRHCPISLEVRKIVDFVESGKIEEAISYGARECISCGSCSYVCLAGKNLTEKVKRAKYK